MKWSWGCFIFLFIAPVGFFKPLLNLKQVSNTHLYPKRSTSKMEIPPKIIIEVEYNDWSINLISEEIFLNPYNTIYYLIKHCLRSTRKSAANESIEIPDDDNVNVEPTIKENITPPSSPRGNPFPVWVRIWLISTLE